MLILFALIILIIWSAIVASIFAIFNPFIDQLWNIQHYNIAYYGAVSSLERSYLILRGHKPGFEWEWWWIGPDNYWPLSDYNNKNDKNYWGIMTVAGNGQKWTISNRNSWGAIPESGMGDIDPDFSIGSGNFDYNKLEFGSPIQIALYKDITSSTWDYYEVIDSWLIDSINPTNIKIYMRVPPLIYNEFGGSLDYMADGNAYDEDDNGIWDDTVAIRSIFGTEWTDKFTIIPSLSVDYEFGNVNNGDSYIRESAINAYNPTELPSNANIFFTNNQNPINVGWRGNPDGWIYLIPNSALSGLNGTGTTIQDLMLNTTDVSKLHLKLSLSNILRYDNDDIYPYLETKIIVGEEIPDLYYHVIWQWKVGKYDVKLVEDIPIFNPDEGSDFVIRF